MTTLVSILIYLAIVGVVLAGGIWLGMLIAPRIGRLTDSNDEGPTDDHD